MSGEPSRSFPRDAAPDRGTEEDRGILVIGAGPTGLAVAALLAQAGCPVTVAERNAAPLAIPRAIVIDDEGLRTLQALGLATAMRARTRKALGARYYDEARQVFAETGEGAETFGFPRRNYLHQPDLEALLLGHLACDRRVTLLPGTEATLLDPGRMGAAEGGAPAPARIRLTGPGGTVTRAFRWVLACDGGRSPVRGALGIGMEGETYGQDWIVLDLASDPDQEPVSRFYCDAGRPQVSIPAPRGGRRYEFMVLPGEDGAQLLGDGALARLLAPFRPFRSGEVLRRAVYTFHARIAREWRRGRVFLLGDAAHLTPPFAGQGMNAGLRDAHNLAWKIALVEAGHAAPAILDSYMQERRDPALAMIRLAVAMGRVVMPSSPEEAAFRAALVRALEPFPAVRDWLAAMRFKPPPAYASGLFLDRDSQPYEGALVGRMAPQPDLQGPAGTGSLDAALGPGFALVAQDGAGAEALAGLSHPFWARLAPVRLALARAAGGVAGGMGRAGFAQTDGRADERARAWATHRDQVLLLRPDRYVAAAFDPPALDAGGARLEALFAAPSGMA